MIKIVSNGTAMGTRVYAEDGTEISGITRIDLLPIEPGGAVSACLTFAPVELDLAADDGDVESIPVSCLDEPAPRYVLMR